MSIFHLLLGLHVAGGSLGLLLGPVPMLSRKGGWLHRNAGFAFCAAMGCGAVSGFGLALIVHSTLLLTIATLTGFLIFSGARAPSFRRGRRPFWVDDLSCLLLTCFSVWLLWHSLPTRDVTGLFFGLGSLILTARQFHMLHTSQPDWLLAHISGMGGAYVATVTAFLVVNLTYNLAILPAPVTFIVPTMIGTVLINWSSYRYSARVRSRSIQVSASLFRKSP